jgi:RNA-directed DNA polymerase
VREVRQVIVLKKRGNARGGKDLGQNHPLKGNVVKTTDFHTTTETKLRRIAWLSKSNRQKVFDNLMHLINEEALEVCFNETDGKKAIGVDKVRKEQYGNHLKANLKGFVCRLKSMSYRPGNIREVRIPKEGRSGETRPLGISNFEDKLFQKMMHKILESIYEPIFLNCSYGFRSGRGCHDAIRALRQHLDRYEVEVIVDIDLANFFGTIDHKTLLGILREKIRDERILRYIARMLKTGVLTQGELVISEEGTAQGSICSPILANIFAHYVLDQWIEETVKAHCKGKVELFRYCDDAVICCQYKQDAERVHRSLVKRLAKYRLKLNEEKTRLVAFSREAYIRQQGKQENFDFLGFNFYWGRTRNLRAVPKIRTSSKRMRSKLRKVTEWVKEVKNKFRLLEIWKKFCQKLEGHARYFGMTFNIARVQQFQFLATKILFKYLNRRSHRKSFSWEKFRLFMQKNPLPKARIWHALF